MHKDVCYFFGVNSYGKDFELQIKKEINRAIKDGYRFFVTGLLNKIDIIGSKIILEKKKENDNIRLICYPRYVNFQNSITNDDIREEIDDILHHADEVIYFYSRRYDFYEKIGTLLIGSSSRVIGNFENVTGNIKNVLEIGIKKGVSLFEVK